MGRWRCPGSLFSSFRVHGSHLYSSLGSFTITLTVDDVDNSANSATTTIPVHVIDAKIVVEGGYIFSLSGSGAVSGTVATFTDPDSSATAAEYSASIDLAAGTLPSVGTINGGGSFTVSGGHTYTNFWRHARCVAATM